jgi:alanyl-tRNA synthetase
LRRAIRYGFTFLNTKEPFIFELVSVLADQMGEFFQKLKKQQSLVTEAAHEKYQSINSTTLSR